MFFLLAGVLCRLDVTEMGVFLRMDVGCAGDFISFFWGVFPGLTLSLLLDCALELLRDLMGILEGESGTVTSLPDDLEAAESSESLFGVPMIGERVVGRETLCLLGVGVLVCRSSTTAGVTLPLRDALS